MKGEKMANSDEGRHNKTLYFITAFLVLLFILVLFSVSKIKLPNLKIDEAATVTMWSVQSFDFRHLLSFLTRESAPDLAVTLLAVGYIDKEGAFAESNTLSSEMIGALRVKVRNAGNEASGIWQLTAELPTREVYSYMSEEQPSLEGREERTFLLSFDSVSERPDKRIIVYAETLTEEERNIANNTAERDLSAIE